MSDSRRIVITGVGRGLGEAMTGQFARLGHIVIGCSQSLDRVMALNDLLGPPRIENTVDYPRRLPHRFDVVNVANEDQVADWANSVLADGPPDLLINNAAVINKNAQLWEVPADEFSWVIDVNIKGVFHVLKHFLPAMVARKSGVIVNFSSGWGRSTSPEVAPYCATKYAIEGLTLALAQELPHGMCAVPLNPGVIQTDMLQSCFGEDFASYPTPEKWAQKAVPFLLGLGPKNNGKPHSVPQ